MKKTIIAILVCAAATANAQKFEIGFNGGIGMNTNLKSAWHKYSVPSEYQPFPFLPVLSVKGIYNHKLWQYGLSLEYRRVAYLQKDFKAVDLYPQPTLLPGTCYEYFGPYRYIAIGSTPVIPVKIFVNRKIKLHRFETYAGLSAGYLFIENSHRKFHINLESMTPNNNGYNALSVGVQAGTTYFLTKRLGLNAEMTGDYLRFHSLNYIPVQMFSFPLSAGICYKL